MIREPGGQAVLQSRRDTTNTALAAALLAMGIPISPIVPAGATNVVGDGISAPGGRRTWYFESQSECGKFKTEELMRAWDDREWHLKNPNHPFAYIKCAFQNCERLIDQIKQDVPLGMVRKRGKIALISLNADRNFTDKVFRRLEAR